MNNLLGAIDKPHAKYPHVYAAVRFDSYVSGHHAAAVVKGIPSRDLAEREPARLHELNQGRGSNYTVQATRFIESEPDR